MKSVSICGNAKRKSHRPERITGYYKYTPSCITDQGGGHLNTALTLNSRMHIQDTNVSYPGWITGAIIALCYFAGAVTPSFPLVIPLRRMSAEWNFSIAWTIAPRLVGRCFYYYSFFSYREDFHRVDGADVFYRGWEDGRGWSENEIFPRVKKKDEEDEKKREEGDIPQRHEEELFGPGTLVRD